MISDTYGTKTLIILVAGIDSDTILSVRNNGNIKCKKCQYFNEKQVFMQETISYTFFFTSGSPFRKRQKAVLPVPVTT